MPAAPLASGLEAVDKSVDRHLQLIASIFFCARVTPSSEESQS